MKSSERVVACLNCWKATYSRRRNTVATMDSLSVKMQVKEDDIQHMKKDLQITVRPDAFPSLALKGKLTRGLDEDKLRRMLTSILGRGRRQRSRR